MGKEQFREWLKQRNPNTQSVEGLKGLNNISTLIGEMESGIDKIKPVGGVYNFPGMEVSSYDKEVTESYQMESPEMLNQFRADSQSGIVKAINAVTSGTLSGLLTAIETSGYILDLPNNIAQITGVESAEDNAISNFAKEMKQKLYGALPIYEDVESTGVMDQFTRWSTLRSMLDSAVGFAIPGGLVSKGIKSIGGGARLAAWANAFIGGGKSNAFKSLLQLGNPTKIAAGLESLAGGLITNYGEGKMMAIELGEELENQYLNIHSQKILKDKYGNNPQFVDIALKEAREMFDKDVDTKREIGRQQNNFMKNNTIFAITDAIGLHNLGLSKVATRQTAKQASLNPFKNMGGIGGLMIQNTKEGIEEIGQNMFQAEAGYQARKAADFQTAEDLELSGISKADRYLEFATSDKALLEGMMGFVSGGLQRQLTQGFYDVIGGDPLGKKRREEQNRQYEIQQKLLESYTDAKLKDIETADLFKKEFVINNQEKLADMIDDTQFLKMARDAAQGGTVDKLERSIRDIINLTPEQAAAKGFSKDYQTNFQNRLRELLDIERMYLQYDGYKTRNELASNRITHKILSNSKSKYQDTLLNGYKREDGTQALSELEELNTALKDSGITPELNNGTLITEVTFENLAVLKDSKQASQIISLPEYKNAFKSYEALSRIENAIKDNNEKYQYIITELESNYEQYQKEMEDVIEKSIDVKKEVDSAENELEASLVNIDLEAREAVINNFKEKYAESPIASRIDGIVERVNNRFHNITQKQNQTTSYDIPEKQFYKGFVEELSKIVNENPELKEAWEKKHLVTYLDPITSNVDDSITREDILRLTSAEGRAEFLQKTDEEAEIFLQILDMYVNAHSKTTTPMDSVIYTDEDFEGDNKVYVSNSSKDEVIDKDILDIDNAIKEQNDRDSGLNQNEILENANISVEYDKKRKFTWKSIAHLARNYVVETLGNKVTFKDADNNPNRPEILRNLQKVKIGDEIEFVVVDNPEQEVYYTEIDGQRNKTTWGEHLSNKGNKANVNLFIPIEIRHNGNLIGYVHALDHLNINRDLDFNTAKSALSTLRNAIYDNYINGKSNIKTKISSISLGHLIKSFDNKLVNTKDALPSNDVRIAIVKNNQLITTQNTVVKEGVLNKTENLKEGFTYAIIPMPGNKALAIPLQRNKLITNQVNNINTAFTIFNKVLNNQPLNSNEQAIVDNIQQDLKDIKRSNAGKLEKVNFNITSLEGLRNYISIYTHVHRAAGPSFDLLKVLADRPRNSLFRAISIESFEEQAGNVVESPLIGRRFVKITLASSNEVATAYKYFPAAPGKPAHLTVIKGKNIRTEFNGDDAIREFNTLFTGSTTNQNGKLATHLSEMTFTPSITLLSNPTNIKLRDLKDPSKFIADTPYSEYVKQNTSSNILSLDISEEGQSPQYIYTQQQIFNFDDSFANSENDNSTTQPINNTPKNTQEVDEEQEEQYKDDTAVGSNGLFTDDDVISFAVDEESVNLNDNAIYRSLVESQLGISIFSPNLKAISSTRQVLEIETMVELLSQALLNSENQKLSEKEWKEIVNIRLHFLNTKIREVAEATNNIASLNYINEVTSPEARPYLEQLIIKAFSERAGIKTNIIYNELAEEGDSEFTGTEGYAEKLRYTDSYAFEVDHRLTMSTKLKLTLSTVPSGKMGFGNVPLSYPFDEIYDRSMALLEGSEPSYEAMIAKLQANAHIYPWISPLINHLNNQDESVRNGFVVVMHKHYVNMLFLGFKQLQQGYKMKVWESNSNAIERTISEQWFNGLIKNESLIGLNASGNYAFTEKAIEMAKSLEGVDMATTIENLPKQKKIIQDLLEEFGIYLSDKTIDEILSGGLYYKGNKQRYMALFGKNGLIIRSLKEGVLKNSEVERESEDINLFNSGIIKALAKLEAKYTKLNLSNSHRTGGKTVNSFSDTRYQVDRLAELKRDSQLITKLAQMPFSKRSTLLKVLAQYDPWSKKFINKDGQLQLNNLNSDDVDMASLFENLKIHYLGLNAIKEIASDFIADKSLDQLGEREHDGIKLAFFFNNKSISEKGLRSGQLFYPTMSNKTVMTTMEVPLSRFELDDTGEISENTLKEMIEVLVLPEIDRMKAFRISTNDGSIKSPLDNYAEGSQVFYTIPELNNIDELFEIVNDKRMIKYGLDDVETLFPLIKTVYSKFIEDTINAQISNWEKIGVGVDLKFVDNDHVNYYKQILPQNSIITQDADGNVETKAETEVDYNRRLVRLMALDFVGNYMYHNMNIFQLFSGDPALYFPKKHIKVLNQGNYVKLSEMVFNNIGKRLAADVAPGLQGDFSSVGKSYTIGVVEDPKLSSELIDVYKKMGLSNSEIKSYQEITTTDGAEFVTLEEHLKIMFVYNKLSKLQYDLLNNRLKQQEANPGNSEFDFTKKELDLIVKGLNFIVNKPVQVLNKPLGYGNNANPEIDSRIYIKSAATPLIPQLTRGRQLDAIRVRMESKNDPSKKIDRLVFSSAMKVGLPMDITNIYDNNTGDVVLENLDKIPMMTLDRSGFRIQQEIPFREDHETINDGTQQRELLFAGLLENKELSELNDIYLDTYNTIFSKAYEKLLSDVNYNKNTGKVDVNKILDIIKKEAVSRNYSINNVIAIGLNEKNQLKYPLWGLPADSAIESLLLSIVDNRVRKLKIPGMAAILSPQEGYKEVDERFKAWEDISNTVSKEDLITTSDFNGTLAPMRPENPNDPNSKWLPAQILISSVLKDAFGKDINVRDYAVKNEDGRWIIDTSILPKELLRSFSYRIPTSSQSSMGYVEIVGFLPESMKEMVVAARDFVAQMGYDFDVDKLYSNLYQIAYNPLKNTFERLEDFDEATVTHLVNLQMAKKGSKLITNTEELDEASIDESQEDYDMESTIYSRLMERIDAAKYFNRLLDIHIQVMAHPETNKLRVKTVNYGKLEILAEEFSQRATTSEVFNPLSPLYQKTKYINATAGQQGVGVFSAGLVFLASVQAAKVNHQTLNKDGANIFEITLNGLTTMGNLSDSKTLDGMDTRLSIMSKFQNTSVDDEALQALARLNINANTFNALTAGTMLGFNEEQLVTLISQPIIVKFAEQLKALQGPFSEYNADASTTVMNALFDELGIEDNRSKDVINAFKEFSVQDLKEFIGKKEFATELEYNTYKAAQYYALDTFIKLKNVGQDILKVQSAVNLSSKGIGKSFIEANKTYNSIKNIELYNPNFINVESLIGEYKRDDSGRIVEIVPKTIRGFVFKYALEPALNIYKDSNGIPLFPYVQRIFREKIDTILEMQGKSDLTGEAYNREVRHIFSALKGYIYSKPNVFGIDNPTNERQRLLIDKKYKVGEEREAGYNIGDRKYSLAGLLELLKDENHPIIQNNKFLKRLEYTINQDGLPSIISYRATVTQSMEELEIYNDFSRLLLTEIPIKINKNGEVFEISSRDLVIDLIKYNYLKGGTQGPTDFARYIPIQYLLNAGVGNQLNNIDFADEDLYGTSTSGFILQYFQHFPNKLKTTLPIVGKFTTEHLKYVSKTEDYYVDSDSYLTSFVPSEGLMSHYDYDLPMLVKMNIGGNKYELFVYDPDSKRYNRVSTLKYKNISEYQAQLPRMMVAQSLFIHNQTSGLKLTVRGTTKSSIGINKNSDLSERDAYLEKYFPKNENSLIASLNEMLSDTVGKGAIVNPKLRIIGKKLIEALDKNGINPMVYVKSQDEMPKHPSGFGVRGAYMPNGDILIRRNLPPNTDVRPAEYFMTTLTHEATHALLDNIVNKYLAGEAIPKEIKIALDKLEGVRNLTHIKAELAKITDIEIKHGVSSLKEFMTAITSSEQFRNFIEKDSSKNRFMEILRELLVAIFGEEFVNNSNNLDFIDNNVLAILDTLTIGAPINSIVASKETVDLITSQTIDLTKYLAGNPTVEDAVKAMDNYKNELQYAKEDGLTKERIAALDEVIKILENYIDNYKSGINVVSAEVNPTNSQIKFEEEQTSGYRNRTIKNAAADATIALAVNFDSAGEKLTKSSVLSQNKKYIPVDLNVVTTNDFVTEADKIVNELNTISPKIDGIILNIAGNGIYTLKGQYNQTQVDEFIYKLLQAVVSSKKLKHSVIGIRTGGQTGVDEAGAKAGLRLGIPTTILAPKGWTFRDINSKDISNEELFKARFETKSALEDEMRGGQSVVKFSLDNAINEGKVVSLEDFNTEIQEQIRSMMEWQNKNC